jgi:FKBP-type peptidyl-prolyl cis-trans isomerase 2
MKKLIIVLLLGLLMFGCIQPTDNGQTVTQNQTKVVKLGDNVTVDYTLKLANGSVIDTSFENVAKEAGLYQAQRTYQPITFLMGAGMVVPGFEKGVTGMAVGETKTFEVTPADGYGTYDQTLVYSAPLFYDVNKTEVVSKSLFDQQGIKLEIDKVINYKNGVMINIKNFTNDTVTVEYVFLDGQTFNFNGMPQKVIGINNDSATLKFAVEKDQKYLASLRTGAPGWVTILDVTNDTFTVDENHPLAGKMLYFTVTVKNIAG